MGTEWNTLLDIAQATRRVICTLALVVLVASAGSTPAYAQDCGLVCGLCGPGKWGREGAIFDGDGGYNMACVMGNKCRECGGAFSIATDSPSEFQMLRAIQHASLEDLPELIKRYRPRLLLDESRRLLAVRGTACNADRVMALVFLMEDKSKALERLKLARLEDFAEFSKPGTSTGVSSEQKSP